MPRRCPTCPDTAADIVAGWRAYPALRSARARRSSRLQPEILTRLQARRQSRRGAGSASTVSCRGLPAGVQLFLAVRGQPQPDRPAGRHLRHRPAAGSYLARNAGVFDAVIGGDFFAPWPGSRRRCGPTCGATAGRRGDYERKLDAARIWAKEWHFRIGVHHLRGLIDAFEAAASMPHLAEAVLAALWPWCWPSSRASTAAAGAWGGGAGDGVAGGGAAECGLGSRPDRDLRRRGG
jgi:[glutamine synthetase] adenylyltransferase / [glutamine synthetase]-adenylyl-L-tyrosine phosphorylase